jgi:hypothetical protein
MVMTRLSGMSLLLLDDGSNRESLLGLFRHHVSPGHCSAAVSVQLIDELCRLE